MSQPHAILPHLLLDFELLRAQKEWLLNQPDSEGVCDGLICLIDAIQDQAVEQGVPELDVFGAPREEEA